MKISVVVPSYNQAQYLDDTLKSLVEQDYENKEIIVMDGGSQDGSLAVIRKYGEHLAYWKSESDGGQAQAIMSGFERATGQVIGWLNSDDRLAPGALGRIGQLVQQVGSPDGVFCGGYQVIDEVGIIQEVFRGTRVFPWIARALGPTICQPGTFFGRDVYRRVAGIDPSLKYALDLDLWMRLLTAGIRFYSLSDIQGQFRRHSFQKGHSRTWLSHCAKEESEIQRRYDLARRGSTRRFVARQIQRTLFLATGRVHKTLAYRLLRHQRIREFSVTYSA